MTTHSFEFTGEEKVNLFGYTVREFGPTTSGLFDGDQPITVCDRDGLNTIEKYAHLSSRDRFALYEFFQAQRDRELGRWRDPESPDRVVYLNDAIRGERCVLVVDERSGHSIESCEEVDAASTFPDYDPRSSAVRYFAAHQGPKPWQDVEPGEVWLLELSGYYGGAAVVSERGYFQFSDDEIEVTADHITSGRRIFPEVEA